MAKLRGSATSILTLDSMLDNAQRFDNTFQLVNELRGNGYEEKAQEVHDKYVEALQEAIAIMREVKAPPAP